MQISKIILWPVKKDLPYRIISLEAGKVNYIVGDKQTGKSSIWPIIDYCFGSSKLRVPIGVVREKVLWYGILLEIEEKNILLARKNNTYGISEWLFESNFKHIPKKPIKNIDSIDEVKSFLSEKLEIFLQNLEKEIISQLEIDKKQRISYRDFLLLNHQAQYSLVNPSSIFVKQINQFSISKVKKYLPLLLFEKVRGKYNFKISEKDKIYHKGSALRKELDYWVNRMESLYIRSHDLKLVNSYKDPASLPVERLVKELEYVISKNHSLLDYTSYSNNHLSKKDLVKILVLGRIKECLEFSQILEKIKNLRYKYYLIDSELKRLKHERQINKYENSAELSELIHLYAHKMNLDFLNLVPFFDETDSTVKFLDDKDSGKKILLSEFGNQWSYIGYNISVYLAFHELLLKNSNSFIFPFLMLDLPNQSIDSNKDHKEFTSLIKTFDFSVKKTNGKLQILAICGFEDELMGKMPNSRIVEVWKKKSALIPVDW